VSTNGVILWRFSFANVRRCSSGTSLAGGVAGREGLGVFDDELGRVCDVNAGDDGESWETNASAVCEKTKPRCSKATTTVRRARVGTRM